MSNIDAISPAAAAAAVTPHDTNTIAPTRGIYVGTAGNLKVMMLDGTALTFTAIAAGIVHPLTVIMVYSTGTTAANVVALR
jgi:hypothetical protein